MFKVGDWVIHRFALIPKIVSTVSQDGRKIGLIGGVETPHYSSFNYEIYDEVNHGV